MLWEEKALRQLLGRQLPLDRIGPGLRRSARRALAGGDKSRLIQVSRSVAAELLRRGDLVRVAVLGNSRMNGPIYLVRGTSDLVDLSVLRIGDPPLAGELRSIKGQEPAGGLQPAGDLDNMLVAMEEAQNLRVGEPQSGQREVILSSILNLLQHFLPGMQLFIWLFEPESSDLAAGPLCGPCSEHQTPPWLELRKTGQVALVGNRRDLPLPIRTELLAPGGKAEQEAESHFHGAVAVPLNAPDETGDPNRSEQPEAGVLFVVPKSSHDREILVRLAKRLSRFVTSRWHRHSEVNLRIHTDSLTGINNRAYFDSQFVLELERVRRRNSELTLVLADLDHFKAVNDTYGHQTGDRVLQSVARDLLDGLRRIDHVCRIGGEEFALILPDTGIEAAKEVIARLMARLDRPTIKSEDGEVLHVTLSFGGVTFPSGGTDTVELYRKADLMLYRSKETGRHRCHFWNQEGVPLVLLPSAQAT